MSAPQTTAVVAETTKLEYVAFDSQMEMPFLVAFFESKLNHDKLDDSARFVLGVYEPCANEDPNLSVRMQIQSGALTTAQAPLGQCRAEGIIKNLNTIEDYKNYDKVAMLLKSGRQIWDAINDGSIFEIPCLLASFFVVSYADLKKHRFWYHFAFPALYSNPLWLRETAVGNLEPTESASLFDAVSTWRYSVDNRQHGFFLVKRVDKEKLREMKEQSAGPKRLFARSESEAEEYDEDDLSFKWVVANLREYENGFFKDVAQEDQYIAFVDSSTFPTAPSWPIRNLLVLLRHRWKLTKAQILCYRDLKARREEPHSLILKVTLPEAEEAAELKEMPKVVGWEKNQLGKNGPRMMNLGELTDPKKLADQAVDLNLKLMKWRISPNLDLDTIKESSCLLLGAGTLGSYVSRNLMGWGVRKITFVDYGSVSFSNPVRQPLFTYEDCLKGGAPKAACAAESLKKINPSVDANGFHLAVPMLGHPVLDEAKTKADLEQLEELIDAHDVILLLMDSRESRWLPTVIGRAKGKIVMNAALGFDTYVVMRHGGAPRTPNEKTLGCYFCNDVVAPGNSQKDQTLDQQCTVTRPGVAAIASALLVELLTSVLQHPDKQHAPGAVANTDGSYDRHPEDHALGIVPHQIRGFLANFQNMVIRGEAYPNCSACSAHIIDAYNEQGWDFVSKCLNDREHVAEISGLAEVQRQAEALAAELELSDDGGGDDDEDDEAVII